MSLSFEAALKGAATLKARSGCKKKRLNGSAPILPIEENHKGDEFGESTSLLAKGAELGVETPDGNNSSPSNPNYMKLTEADLTLQTHSIFFIRVKHIRNDSNFLLSVQSLLGSVVNRGIQSYVGIHQAGFWEGQFLGG